MESSELLNRLRWGYGACLFTVFVVGILMLFYDKLRPFWQDKLIPSLVLYAVGDAVIATARTEHTRSANTRAMAEARIKNAWKPERFQRGLPKKQLVLFSVLHATWFLVTAGFIAVLVWVQ